MQATFAAVRIECFETIDIIILSRKRGETLTVPAKGGKLKASRTLTVDCPEDCFPNSALLRLVVRSDSFILQLVLL